MRATEAEAAQFDEIRDAFQTHLAMDAEFPTDIRVNGLIDYMEGLVQDQGVRAPVVVAAALYALVDVHDVVLEYEADNERQTPDRMPCTCGPGNCCSSPSCRGGAS